MDVLIGGTHSRKGFAGADAPCEAEAQSLRTVYDA
jgi:hypothetical protein